MKETVLKALYLWIILILITQPIIDYIDYLKDLIVKSNTSYITQKAAVDGTVSDALKTDVINNLKSVGFQEDEITIEFENVIKDRKERLDVVIQVERPRMFLYSFTSVSQPQYYYGHGYIMSEYLD